jgi:RNA polymerase sigma factor (TIGR02999 family)
MSELSQILSAIEHGDPQASEKLLPLVYQQLRALAARQLARELPGQTLQATALVHEAYLRLMNSETAPRWDGRRHFFAAAAKAMRRILIENARRKKRIKHGGGKQRVELEEELIAGKLPVEDVLVMNEDLLVLDEALEAFGAVDTVAAELVELCYFSGLSTEEAAEILNISARTGYRKWAFAKAWLYRRIHGSDPPAKDGAPPAQ